MAYAAGTLDEAFSVLVSCHIEVCEHCQEVLKTAEQIGGANLDKVTEAQLDEGSLWARAGKDQRSTGRQRPCASC